LGSFYLRLLGRRHYAKLLCLGFALLVFLDVPLALRNSTRRLDDLLGQSLGLGGLDGHGLNDGLDNDGSGGRFFGRRNDLVDGSRRRRIDDGIFLLLLFLPRSECNEETKKSDDQEEYCWWG